MANVRSRVGFQGSRKIATMANRLGNRGVSPEQACSGSHWEYVMRAIFALSLLSAALICAPRVLSAAPAEATPESQKAMGPAAPTAPKQVCPGNPDPLGVARVVEIDTTGGPGFGFQNYKEYDFLQPKEVVLTFDDGPLPGAQPQSLPRSRRSAPRPPSSRSARSRAAIPKSCATSPRRATPLEPTPSTTKTSRR